MVSCIYDDASRWILLYCRNRLKLEIQVIYQGILPGYWTEDF